MNTLWTSQCHQQICMSNMILSLPWRTNCRSKRTPSRACCCHDCHLESAVCITVAVLSLAALCRSLKCSCSTTSSRHSDNGAAGVCLVYKVFAFLCHAGDSPHDMLPSVFVHFHYTSPARLWDPTVRVFILVWSLPLVWLKKKWSSKANWSHCWPEKHWETENDVCENVRFYSINLGGYINSRLTRVLSFKKCVRPVVCWWFNHDTVVFQTYFLCLGKK